MQRRPQGPGSLPRCCARGGLAQRGGVLAYHVASAVSAGQLRVVLPGFEPPALPIHLVYPTGRLLSAKVKAFAELVAESCDWEFEVE